MTNTDPTLREVAELLRTAAAKLDALAGTATAHDDAASTPAPSGARTALLELLRELPLIRREEQASSHALERARQQVDHLQAERDAAARQVAENDGALTSGESLMAGQDRADAVAAARARLAEIEADLVAADMAKQQASTQYAATRERLELTLQQLRASATGTTGAPEIQGGAPVRVMALLALKELGAPVSSSLLGDYIKVRYGRDVRPDRWGALRRDELKAWDSARRRNTRRTAWLCPALDGDSGEAVTGLWTRSDWPMSLRVVLEGDQTLHLRLLYRLGVVALAPPADTYDVNGLRHFAIEQLTEELTAALDGPTVEEGLGSTVLLMHDMLVAGDNAEQVRAHDPDSDRPAAPDWFDDLNLPDSDRERLFGRDDIPF